MADAGRCVFVKHDEESNGSRTEVIARSGSEKGTAWGAAESEACPPRPLRIREVEPRTESAIAALRRLSYRGNCRRRIGIGSHVALDRSHPKHTRA
jgi:hypothetical protein